MSGLTRKPATSLPVGLRAKAFIKGWERLRLSSYKDAAGKPTIGWGHLQAKGEPDHVTVKQANAMFEADVAKIAQAVQKAVRVPLWQCEFDALVSLAYNIGPAAFKKSTLLKLLNKGDYRGAADQFPRWHYAGGVPLDGLKRRRAAERAMFCEIPI